MKFIADEISELTRKSGLELVESDLTNETIVAAIAVHRELGPGLLESAYQASMCHELRLREISFRSQLDVPVQYKRNTSRLWISDRFDRS